jgi:Cupin domain
VSTPRVVEAGVDESRRSTIIRDQVTKPRVLPTGRELTELWRTERVVQEFDATPTAGHGPFPPVNGARLWRLVIPPDDPSAPAPFHATATVDMGFVLRGRVTLELEDGSAADLVEGDSFVQQGAAHRWLNHGSADAVLGVVVVGTGGHR